MDVTFVSTTHGDQMALQLLKRTIDEDGSLFIRRRRHLGGTSFYAGRLESTPPIPQMSFQRGSSVGQAWSISQRRNDRHRPQNLIMTR